MHVFLLTVGIAAAVGAGVSEFEAGLIPKAQSEIGAACDAKPAISVTWDDFGDDADAAAGLVDGGLGFLSSALGEVCKDAALKGEVGKQISKIVLSQAYGTADPVVYLTQRTLHIEYLWMKGQPGPDAAFVRDEIASRLKGEEAEAP
jgi:hypothetical protein